MDGKLGPSPSASLSTVCGPLTAAALGTALPVTRAGDFRHHQPQHTPQNGGGKIHRGERCPQDSEQIRGQAGTQTQLSHLAETGPTLGGRRRPCRPDDGRSPHPSPAPSPWGLATRPASPNRVGADVMPTTARAWLVRRCEGGSGRKRERENLHRAQARPPNWVRCPSLLLCKMRETESLPRKGAVRLDWAALRPEDRVASGGKLAPWRPQGALSVKRPPSRPGCRVPARIETLGCSVTALCGCKAPPRFPGLCSNFVSTGVFQALSPHLVYALKGVSCQGGGDRQAVVM